MGSDNYNRFRTVSILEDKVFKLKKVHSRLGLDKGGIGLINPQDYELVYKLINETLQVKQDLLQQPLRYTSDHQHLLHLYDRVCFLESELYNLVRLSPNNYTDPNSYYMFDKDIKTSHCKECDKSFLHTQKQVIPQTSPIQAPLDYFFDKVQSSPSEGLSSSSGESLEEIIYIPSSSSSEITITSDYTFNQSENNNCYKPSVRRKPFIDVRKSKSKLIFKKDKRKPIYQRHEIRKISNLYLNKIPEKKKMKKTNKLQLSNFTLKKSKSSKVGVYSKKIPQKESQIYFVRRTRAISKNKNEKEVKIPQREKYYISRMKRLKNVSKEKYKNNTINNNNSKQNKKSRKYNNTGNNNSEEYRTNYTTSTESGFIKSKWRREPQKNIHKLKVKPNNKSHSLTVANSTNVSNFPIVTSKYVIQHYKNPKFSIEDMTKTDKTFLSKSKKHFSRKHDHNLNINTNKYTNINCEELLIPTSEWASINSNNFEIDHSHYIIDHYIDPEYDVLNSFESNKHSHTKPNKIYSVLRNGKQEYLKFSHEKKDAIKKTGSKQSSQTTILNVRKRESNNDGYNKKLLIVDKRYVSTLKQEHINEYNNKFEPVSFSQSESTVPVYQSFIQSESTMNINNKQKTSLSKQNKRKTIQQKITLKPSKENMSLTSQKMSNVVKKSIHNDDKFVFTNNSINMLSQEDSRPLLAEDITPETHSNVRESSNETYNNATLETIAGSSVSRGGFYKKGKTKKNIPRDLVRTDTNYKTESTGSKNSEDNKTDIQVDLNYDENLKEVTPELTPFPLKKLDTDQSNVSINVGKKSLADNEIKSEILPSIPTVEMGKPKQSNTKSPRSKNELAVNPNQEPLIYSLKFSRERHKRADLTSMSSAISLNDILSTTCKPVSYTEEVYFSEQKLNDTEMHKKFHKTFHHSEENMKRQTERGNLRPKCQKNEKFNCETLKRSKNGPAKNPMCVSRQGDSHHSSIDWKKIAREIKQCS